MVITGNQSGGRRGPGGATHEKGYDPYRTQIILLGDTTPGTNGQVIGLKMYGDAQLEVHDITFTNSIAVGSSSTSFNDDGDNTWSANIRISDTPTDIFF